LPIEFKEGKISIQWMDQWNVSFFKK